MICWFALQDSASSYAYTSFKNHKYEPNTGASSKDNKGILDKDDLVPKFEDSRKE